MLNLPEISGSLQGKYSLFQRNPDLCKVNVCSIFQRYPDLRKVNAHSSRDILFFSYFFTEKACSARYCKAINHNTFIVHLVHFDYSFSRILCICRLFALPLLQGVGAIWGKNLKKCGSNNLGNQFEGPYFPKKLSGLNIKNK